MNTLKVYIDVNHIKPERSGPLLVDADWCAFCQALYKGIEGKDWEEMYDSCKAKALWATKAAKDRKEEFYDPARKGNMLGRNTTRLELWEEHLKDPIVALDNALKCVEDQ